MHVDFSTDNTSIPSTLCKSIFSPVFFELRHTRPLSGDFNGVREGCRSKVQEDIIK
jgi:hypothetical protein